MRTKPVAKRVPPARTAALPLRRRQASKDFWWLLGCSKPWFNTEVTLLLIGTTKAPVPTTTKAPETTTTNKAPVPTTTKAPATTKAPTTTPPASTCPVCLCGTTGDTYEDKSCGKTCPTCKDCSSTPAPTPGE